jgi:hypothetical protein
LGKPARTMLAKIWDQHVIAGVSEDTDFRISALRGCSAPASGRLPARRDPVDHGVSVCLTDARNLLR